jgi:hypothetical protein
MPLAVRQHPAALLRRSGSMSSNRSVRAGDPFAYAGSRQDQDHLHACIDGWVYLGFEGEDENGELVEEIERVPCRRSADRR